MQKPQNLLRTLVIAALVLVGLVALYAALGFFALPRLVTGLVQDTVRADYGRELAIGAVRFNPFTLTLEADKVVLPDADGSPMLAFDRLLVDLESNSLWRRALSFRTIGVDGLAVNALIRPGGALNLADLAPPADPAAPPPPEEPLPRLVIDELRVTEGRVRFEDRDRGEPFVADLKPITFRLTDFSTYQSGGDRYELDATLFDASRFAWRGTLKAQPLASDGEFTLSDVPLPRLAEYLGDALRLEITRGAASLRGSYRFADRSAGVDLVVEAGELTIADLAIRDRGEATDYLDLQKVTATGISASLADEKAVLGEVTLAGGAIQVWLTPEGELKRSGIFDPLVLETPAGAAQSAGSTAADPGGGWQVSIPRIRVRDLALSLEDRALKPAPVLVLKPLEVAIDGYATTPGATVRIDASAGVNDKGALKVAGTTNLDTFETAADLELRGLDLTLAQPYLAQQTSLTLKGGTFGAQGRLTYQDGKPAARLGFSGEASIDGLRTVDNVLREDFLKWDALRLSGIEYRSAPEALKIARVDARAPYARIIIGPDGTTNISAILAGPGAVSQAVVGPTLGPAASRDGDKVAVVRGEESPAQRPPKPPAESPLPFPVSVGTVRVANGSANFADFSTRPNFAIGIQKLKGSVAGLSSVPDSRAQVELDGEVGPFAPVTIRGQVNPLAAEAFLDLAMTLRNVELASFTPYSGRFAGYSIRQGKLSADLNYKVVDRQLDASNKFVINQLELGDKVDSPDAVSLPLKLAVALLKDRNGVIDLELPITGDLDNPQFRIGPIVWKVLVNLLTKAVTAPFALIGSLFGGGDDVNVIEFDGGTAALDAADQEKLGSLVKALTERPGLKLNVPAVYGRAADEPALRQQALADQVVAARRAELAAKKQPDDGVDFAAVRGDPETYLRLLTGLYRPEAGAVAPLPEPPPEAATPEARIGFLEEQLRQKMVVDEPKLFALAKARAEAVQARLLTDTGVDPERVFIISPAEGKAGENGVMMELALQ